MTSIRVEHTPDGRRLCVSREIAARPEDAWDLLVDTHRWSEWGPSVTGVSCDSRRVERGTTGRVQVVYGPWVPFEVTACDGSRWTWSVAGIPATGHRVEDAGGGRCRVTFEIPPLAGGYAPVCVRALGKIERLLGVDEEG